MKRFLDYLAWLIVVLFISVMGGAFIMILIEKPEARAVAILFSSVAAFAWACTRLVNKSDSMRFPH